MQLPPSSLRKKIDKVEYCPSGDGYSIGVRKVKAAKRLFSS